MSWMIRAYERDGDALVREIAVDEALRTTFRRLLQRPEGDPMVDSFPLDAAAVQEIAEFFGLDLDTTKEDYFLDDDAQHS